MIISIHALREEGDFSTLAQVMATQGISIHALREEGDALIRGQEQFPADFYPRPPRGGRLASADAPRVCLIFLSTPSARRATDKSPSG